MTAGVVEDSPTTVPILTAPGLSTVPNLVHGFTGRDGGVSQGPFASLNLSYVVGDDPGHVEKNWNILGAHVGNSLELVTMRQVHGTEVIELHARPAERPVADGLTTSQPGLALGAMTADCVPLLLAAPDGTAIAAVHAGWRGTAGAIVRAAVARMVAATGVAPASLRAALGPAIDGCCFEIGAEVVAAFTSAGQPLPASHRRSPGDPDKSFLDLRDVNIELLLSAGLRPDNIERIGPCTRCAGDRFFSHRGSGGTTGRQLSFIALL